MLRFSANLSTLFGELPLIERPAAAARAGFEAVEVWFPYEVPACDFRNALTASGVTCVGINTPPGDTQRGDWGLAADPSRREAFLRSVDAAMTYADTIGCPNVHVMAGAPPAGLPRAAAWKVYCENIAAACAIAKLHGRQVLVEPLNAIDRPTYLLSRQAEAIELIDSLGCDNLRIMLDLYHLQRGEGNLIERMRASLPYSGHVQFADVPGRHEPGTGEINFPAVFAELERLQYQGWVGCEYFPRTTTLESFGWMSGAIGC